MGIAERREREKAKRRAVILSSAEDLFFHQGYEKTRMLQIAEACELSKGALYLYFNNKEDLAKAVVVRSYDIFLEILREKTRDERRGLDKVRAMIDGLLTIYRDHQRNFYLTLVLETQLEDRLNDNRVWAERAERIERIHQLAADILRMGIDDGSVREDLDPDLAATTAITAAVGFVHRVFQFGDHVTFQRYSVETLVAEFAAIIVNAVSQGA